MNRKEIMAYCQKELEKCKSSEIKDVRDGFPYKEIIRTIKEYEEVNEYIYDVNGKRVYSGRGRIDGYFPSKGVRDIYYKIQRNGENWWR